jgi:rubrerythrin
MQYYYAVQPSSNVELISDISKAINGEYSAIHCYKQLANQVPNAEIKEQILEIRDDEIRHYHAFSQIYTYLSLPSLNWTITPL